MPLSNLFRSRLPADDIPAAIDTSASERAQTVVAARRTEAAHAAEAAAVARQAYDAALAAAAATGGPVSDGETDRLFRAYRAAVAHQDRVNDAVAAAEAIFAQALQREQEAQRKAARAAINNLADARNKAGQAVAVAAKNLAEAARAFDEAHVALWHGLPGKVRAAIGVGTPTGDPPWIERELQRLQLVPGWTESSGVPEPPPIGKRCEQYTAMVKRLIGGDV